MSEPNRTLPLLPLTSGVVLPGMVFTMALETDEAKAAADAAGSVGGELVLVPHIDGRYASVGVIAKILEVGELPGGPLAMVVSGAGGFTMNGTGLLAFNETNSYSGTTTLNQGTIQLGNTTALGTGSLVINGGVLQSAGASSPR